MFSFYSTVFLVDLVLTVLRCFHTPSGLHRQILDLTASV